MGPGALTPARANAATRRGEAIMRRVDAFITAHARAAIPLAALCEAGGCSAKTLETLFLRTHGLTPNRYVRNRRLRHAREALLAASPGEASISGIALDWGFCEFGRFAVAYRQLFGETPSQTLRCPCTDSVR